ncbi:hypothetical protein EDC01DRAFT_667621 [Geopyxis carbonaria]|nr:hypothetical protein EDC01DRAFT_667621 [Geopyxis carbonaria]
MPFAQLVIGPPGSGKSTYCNGMHQFMSAIGRKCSIVNLDPANDNTSYPCALDIRSIVTLEEVMDEEGLGPNGGVMYALEELEENVEWLEEGLSRLGQDYVLFDCPGQVELFTHHQSLKRIFARMQKMGYRLVVVHLVDAHYCSDPSKYISILLLSLRSMLQLDLPHVNVLSKIDLLHTYGPLPFNLDFYTDVQDLSYLLPLLSDDPRTARFAKLNEAIVDLVENFALVNFETLAVEDKKSMTHLLQTIDRAGGYAFGEAEGAGDSVWAIAMRGGWSVGMEAKDIQERWIDAKDEWDEHERKMEEEERKAAEARLQQEEEMGMM